MKITIPDVTYLDWEKIGQKMREDIAQKIIDISKEAETALKDLKPGQRRTFPIKIGSITISRAKE